MNRRLIREGLEYEWRNSGRCSTGGGVGEPGADCGRRTADAAGSQCDHGEELRLDEVRPSVDRGAVMAVAPETDGRFFKVPKVIER
jgi:hypothetical protein